MLAGRVRSIVPPLRPGPARRPAAGRSALSHHRHEGQQSRNDGQSASAAARDAFLVGPAAGGRRTVWAGRDTQPTATSKKKCAVGKRGGMEEAKQGSGYRRVGSDFGDRVACSCILTFVAISVFH